MSDYMAIRVDFRDLSWASINVFLFFFKNLLIRVIFWLPFVSAKRSSQGNWALN